MEKKHILLVEDNPDDEELTIRALRKNNIVNEIAVVRDGQEAIDYLLCQHKYKNRDIKDTPVVILLDLKLPKVDGLDVLRRIRGEENIAIIPVIVLTSSKEEQDIIRSFDFQIWSSEDGPHLRVERRYAPSPECVGEGAMVLKSQELFLASLHKIPMYELRFGDQNAPGRRHAT